MQRARSFPLPDYDLSDPQRVVVRIAGRIIDEKYTRLLLKNTDLPLADVIALDKVQKKRPLDDDVLVDLKRRRLVEGRGKSVFVTASIAAATDDKAGYIQNRGVDHEHYRNLVEVFLTKFPESSRRDLEDVLVDKLPAVLSREQKKNRVKNLLQELRREGHIEVVGEGPKARWRLSRSSKPRASRDV